MADILLRDGIRPLRGTGNRYALPHPLISQRAQTIVIGERAHHGERIVELGRHRVAAGAALVLDRHAAGHGVVEVHDRVCRNARDGFGRAAQVGLHRTDADRRANVGLRERVGRRRRPGDYRACSQPLERHRAEPVWIGNGRRRREHVPLAGGRCAAAHAAVRDRHRARHRLVDVRHVEREDLVDGEATLVGGAETDRIGVLGLEVQAGRGPQLVAGDVERGVVSRADAGDEGVGERVAGIGIGGGEHADDRVGPGILGDGGG